MMKKYLSIIDQRTYLVMGITLLVSFVTLKYNFSYNFDLTVISIAIVFPLVFTIRGAFRRREKALEYLAKFKAGLISLNSSFYENGKLDISEKGEIFDIINNININFLDYLGPKSLHLDKTKEEIVKIFRFIDSKTDKFSYSSAMRCHGYLNDIHQAIEFLAAVKLHGTPMVIRAYTLIFIFIFPLIYTPAIYYNLIQSSDFHEPILVYILAFLTSFILISLYNIQEQLENPFDQIGVDDIQLDGFGLDKNHM
jgi:predicted membrane chloride channel (bestrophin family)